MVCIYCRERHHDSCPASAHPTHCDCQHDTAMMVNWQEAHRTHAFWLRGCPLCEAERAMS